MTRVPIPDEPTRQELALRAVVERLKDAAGPDGPRVHRNRTRPYAADDLDPDGAVVVYPISEEGEVTNHSDIREDTFRFRTELRVRAPVASEVTVDQRLDRLWAWIAVVVMEDPEFGGLFEDLDRRRRSWDAIEGDYVFGGMGVEWEGTLYTSNSDPREAS